MDYLMIKENFTCSFCNKIFIKEFKYNCYYKSYIVKENYFCSQTCATRHRNSIYPSGMKGKHQSEEAKRKISEANTGKKIGLAVTSEEMNERQKKLKTGFKN